MAARNVKSVPGFEVADKMQSSTLKRQPSPDWSKNDLLRLLSYFEGELQARDITIAALKAEKAKQLLYQAKYGRFGLGDPFVALQRDTIGTGDATYDEGAVKSMYDNQLAQLENLIATQRKAQLKMREQLASAEKRFHKVCSELEDEKRKHAQDTAQGDDVTYMLEKERERLRQEIDFEKSSSKKLEKDLRRTLAALEEERASAARHKQVALLLLKERKHILHSDSDSDPQQPGPQGDGLSEEDGKLSGAADNGGGRSFAMETALEKQLTEFEAERAALRAGLDEEQGRSRDLESQVEALQRQVQTMAARTPIHQLHTSPQPPSPYAPPASSFSPASTFSPSTRFGLPKAQKLQLLGGTECSSEALDSPVELSARKGTQPGNSSDVVSGGAALSPNSREARVLTVGSSGPDSQPLLVGGGGAVGTSRGGPRNAATVVTQGAGKVALHVSPGSNLAANSPRRTLPVSAAGRGAPPPVPPNKPNAKPSPPPKVAVNRVGSDSKVVQIPINIVNSPASSSSSTSSASNSQSSKETSPIRKAAQPRVEVEVDSQSRSPLNGTDSKSPTALEFLGPEMARLQQLLASLSSGESGARHSPGLASPPPSSPSLSPAHPPSPSSQASSIFFSPSSRSRTSPSNSAVSPSASSGTLSSAGTVSASRHPRPSLPLPCLLPASSVRMESSSECQGPSVESSPQFSQVPCLVKASTSSVKLESSPVCQVPCLDSSSSVQLENSPVRRVPCLVSSSSSVQLESSPVRLVPPSSPPVAVPVESKTLHQVPACGDHRPFQTLMVIHKTDSKLSVKDAAPLRCAATSHDYQRHNPS